MRDVQPLRVMHVCLHTDPYDEPGSGDVGGMNVVVRHTAEAMAAAGHEVDVVTRRSGAEAESESHPVPGVRVLRLDVGPARRIPKGEHEGLIAPFADRLRALQAPDVVHSHHWFSGAAALPVAREWGVPHVQTFHSIAADPATELSAGERPESPGRLAGEAVLARESDLVLAVSRAEAATVRDRLGGSRVALAPPGVDPVLFTTTPHPPRAESSLTADSALSAGTGYVLLAARLEPLKGIDLAIAALGRVPADQRPALVVAGGPTADETYPEQLRALAQEQGVDARFVGPQPRPALAALMRGARALLVPSHSETYGLVALEAAASGIPVIAAAVGGLREAVVDGVTGVLLNTRDPRHWASTVSKLLADPARAARVGKAAREHALHHTWARTAERVVDAYLSLLPR